MSSFLSLYLSYTAHSSRSFSLHTLTSPPSFPSFSPHSLPFSFHPNPAASSSAASAPLLVFSSFLSWGVYLTLPFICASFFLLNQCWSTAVAHTVPSHTFLPTSLRYDLYICIYELNWNITIKPSLSIKSQIQGPTRPAVSQIPLVTTCGTTATKSHVAQKVFFTQGPECSEQMCIKLLKDGL